MTTFPAPHPHAPPEEIFPDVFLVRGCFKMGPLMRISRNMVVLREGRDLTLVNAMRLTPEGETALEGLGTVRHLVKLGHFHTLDDPYTRDRFSPTFWAPSPGKADAKAEKLADGAAGPLARARVFTFQKTSEGESALVVEQAGGNLLLTCDSVQHWPDTSHCSFLGGLVVRQMGFMADRAKIGPIWVKKLSGENPRALWPDFERLLAHDFVHMLSGHGGLLRDDARTALTASAHRVVRDATAR